MKKEISVHLNTDYVDYYDSFIPEEGEDAPDVALVWNRPYIDFSRPRKESLKELEGNCWNVVPFGEAEEFGERLSPEMVVEHGHEIDVVVIKDQLARDGQEKEKMNIFLAEEQHPTSLVTLYLEPKDPFTSYRYLRIGKKQFLLSRTGDSWNNSGADWYLYDNFNIKIGQQPILDELPLFAVDLIQATDGEMYAIDFCPSPVLANTPIQEKYPPSSIAHLIKEFCNYQFDLRK